ncbi:metal ABC transporter permease [Clostridium sulfidigenes]|uniref:metal ABC transporter permease n=1 Tax=Clostridium sulfidigenes TaxID=318464 RepID=UPI003F8C6823
MFQYEFMQNAFLAAIFISILCPMVGVFLVLKRHSMMGDTLAHSAFAGVAIGLVMGFNPIICAFIFTTICGLSIEFLRDYYKKYAELILSIVLTFSVGIGITLISTGKASGNVNSYLFGSILTVTKADLIIMVILSCISILVIYFLYDKLLYTTFDEEGAKISGINVKAVNYIFSLLVGATISVSIRIMGILVMSSMIALPVATALQLDKGFKPTLLLSILFGFIDIILGLIFSYILNCAPGGTIALTSVVILIIIIIFKSTFKSRN